jgi:hypothetical protein
LHRCGGASDFLPTPRRRKDTLDEISDAAFSLDNMRGDLPTLEEITLQMFFSPNPQVIDFRCE